MGEEERGGEDERVRGREIEKMRERIGSEKGRGRERERERELESFFAFIF